MRESRLCSPSLGGEQEFVRESSSPPCALPHYGGEQRCYGGELGRAKPSWDIELLSPIMRESIRNVGESIWIRQIMNYQYCYVEILIIYISIGLVWVVKPHIFHFLPVFWDIFGIEWCLRSCQQWTTTSGNVSKESRTLHCRVACYVNVYVFKRVLSEYLQLTLRRLRDILLHQPTNDSLCSKVNGTRRFSQINVYFGN